MSSASPDHPRMAAAVGRVEPAPRRVRGLLGDVVAFDTTEARYVWEVPYYPQYYIPLTDVRQDVIETHTSAVRVFHDGPLAGLVRFDWDALTWFEEDEQIHVHPRNPYTRVDALRSNRHVVVSRDEVVLADTRSPVLLFETGLPTRYYIDRMNVRFDRLEPSDTTSHCPYKGVTSGYWSVRIGDGVHRDLAWSYDYPLPAVSAISGTGGVLQREGRHQRRWTRAGPAPHSLQLGLQTDDAVRAPDRVTGPRGRLRHGTDATGRSAPSRYGQIDCPADVFAEIAMIYKRPTANAAACCTMPLRT